MYPYVPQKSSRPWIWQHRFMFTAAATFISASLYLALFAIGFVPQSFQYQTGQVAQAQQASPASSTVNSLESVPQPPSHALPQHVSIPAVGIDTTILNPASRDASVLNNYLNRGAVRYPRSGHPGNGNLFLFGHSTSRTTVWNQAYKSFNNLENVSVGDEITVRTESGSFYYRVQSKSFKENSQAYVPLHTDNDMLTISTCDSFGSKEDRIVVRADFTNYVPTTHAIDK